MPSATWRTAVAVQRSSARLVLVRAGSFGGRGGFGSGGSSGGNSGGGSGGWSQPGGGGSSDPGPVMASVLVGFIASAASADDDKQHQGRQQPRLSTSSESELDDDLDGMSDWDCGPRRCQEDAFQDDEELQVA